MGVMRKSRKETLYIFSCMMVLIPCWALSSKSIPTGARDWRNNKRQIIINGSTASQHEYPYASSILFGSKHLCGASLIAPDIVLSAAHCFQKSIAWNHYRDRLQIVVGEYHLQDQEDGGESFSIETIDIHPDYIETPNYLENDAVVIKLSGESRRRIVKLNQHDMGNQGDMFTVLGWGSLDVNGTIFANVLQEVNLGYISNDECKQRGVPVVTNQMICAVDLDDDGKTEDSCYGDSGGPMILSNSYPPPAATTAGHKKDIQVGIVSFGSKVCGMFPGVYTRITSVFDWIRERVCALSKNPPDYFRCDDLFAFITVAPTISYLSINLTNVASPSATMLQPEHHENMEDSGVNNSIISTISNHYDSPLSKTTNEPTPAGVPVTNQTLDSQSDEQDIDAVVSVTYNGTTDETSIERPWGDHDDEQSSSASYDSLLVLSSVQGILMVSYFVLMTASFLW